MFNVKVEFTLKEILRITKKEFHNVIIDSIKQRMKLMKEVRLNYAINAYVCEDKKDEFGNCCK